MEKRHLFRARQEVPADDYNVMQDYIRDSIDHIVGDAISTERRFVGFPVVKEAPAAIRIGVGRLYQAGQVFVSDQDVVKSFTGSLPAVFRKMVAVYTFGQTIETGTTERYFVTDWSTVPPTSVAQAVTLTRLRLAQIDFSAGIESVDPQLPALPDGACLIASFVLSTTGVVDGSIVRAASNLLPNLQGHNQRLSDLDLWRAATGAKVDTLTAEQASILARTQGKAEAQDVFTLMGDVARLKQLANLPSTGVPYDADNFRTSAKIDLALAPLEPTNAATWRISKTFPAALFPSAARTTAPVALFNNYDDASVTITGDLVLPKFKAVVAVEVPGRSGSVNMSRFAATSTVTKQYTGYTTETHYGY